MPACLWILRTGLSPALAQLPPFSRLEPASVSSSNVKANADSGAPRLNGDGRYVAFWSRASNLVPADTNDVADVFIRDRLLGITVRASIDSAGNQGNGGSHTPSISADGRWVAFISDATNLVVADTNHSQDVFVFHVLTGAIERISVSSGGEEANGHSADPSISADGRYVAFGSIASNLVENDTNDQQDVFVHDRLSRTTMRVSVDTDGSPGQLDSNSPHISADGRYIAFVSNNRFADRSRRGRDIFVRDLHEGTTELVSLGMDGREAASDSLSPAMSADGRHVVFSSSANLIEGGINGQRADIFIRDRLLETTERVSVSSIGAIPNGSSETPAVSACGRYVVFSSSADNLITDDKNLAFDTFVRDRISGATFRLSTSETGIEGNANSLFPSISEDGRHVAFVSLASNLVANDSNDQADVFVISRCDQNACGDGLLDVKCEECDDGNLDDGDGCDSNCTVTRCGNGIISDSEDCDDGNLIDGDGCEADCRLTPPTPTQTASPTSSRTPLPTPSATLTATPQLVHIDVGAASGVPGETVIVPVTIRSSNFGSVATGNDITFRNDLFDLFADGCVINPELRKTLTYGVLTAGLSSTVRVFVQSREDREVISDGGLYECSFRIKETTLPGTYALANESIIVFGRDGVVHEFATGISGGIIVGLVSTPRASATATATPSPPGTATTTPTATRIACAGDCNGDRLVTVDEVVVLVNIALGTRDVASCVDGDINGDNDITIEEIVSALQVALGRCPNADRPH